MDWYRRVATNGACTAAGAPDDHRVASLSLRACLNTAPALVTASVTGVSPSAAPAPGPLVPATAGARGILAPPPAAAAAAAGLGSAAVGGPGAPGALGFADVDGNGAGVDSLASLQSALDQIRAEFNNKKHRDRGRSSKKNKKKKGKRSRSSDRGDKKGKSSRRHRSSSPRAATRIQAAGPPRTAAESSSLGRRAVATRV